jgi:hypothetical protein
MCEELDALIGVGWGQRNPKRKGYRNGSYTRDLVTAGGSHLGDQRTARPWRPVPHPGRGTAIAAMNRTLIFPWIRGVGKPLRYTTTERGALFHAGALLGA